MSDTNRITDNMMELNEEYSMRMRELQVRMDRANSISILIPRLLQTNQISHEEFEKWALDPTGQYCPKLKTEE